MDNDVGDKWAEFLNPDLVRMKLQTAGLFLIAYESLKSAIIGKPLFFFSDNYDADGEPLENSTYREKVLSLDPKGKQDKLRGSLVFQQQMGAISDDDRSEFKGITDCRNRLAHGLSELLQNTNGIEVIDQFPKLIALLSKIEKWWIINFEFEVNPPPNVESIDIDGILPGPVWSIQMLSQIAMGQDDEAWYYYNEFVKNRDQS